MAQGWTSTCWPQEHYPAHLASRQSLQDRLLDSNSAIATCRGSWPQQVLQGKLQVLQIFAIFPYKIRAPEQNTCKAGAHHRFCPQTFIFQYVDNFKEDQVNCDVISSIWRQHKPIRNCSSSAYFVLPNQFVSSSSFLLSRVDSGWMCHSENEQHSCLLVDVQFNSAEESLNCCWFLEEMCLSPTFGLTCLLLWLQRGMK